MEALRVIEVLGRRKWVILLTTLVAVLVVGLGSYNMTPIYSASAVVRIAQGAQGPIDSVQLGYADRLINTYIQEMKGRSFMGEVIRRLSLGISPDTLSSMVKIDAMANTELMNITAESSSPSKAATIVDTIATLLVEQGQQLYSGQGKSAKETLQEQASAAEKRLGEDRAALAQLTGQSTDPSQATAAQDLNARIKIEEQTYATLLSQYDKARVDEAIQANSIAVVETAAIPDSPVRPKPLMYIAMALLAGLVTGVALAFLADSLDPSFHSEDDLEAAVQLPILSRIPSFTAKKGSRVLDSTSWSPAGEAFSILSTNALFLSSETPWKTLLVTSAEPQVGKSTILVNLAATMARSQRKVIVVDSDLNRPNLHRLLNLPAEPGLCDVLAHPSLVLAALQDTGIPGVRLLPGGSSSGNTNGTVMNANMQEVIRKLEAEADVVLLDCPPLMLSGDAALLASLADEILLVVARDRSSGKNVALALKQLEWVGAKTLGIVFNRAKRPSYHYGPESHPKNVKRKGAWTEITGLADTAAASVSDRPSA